MRIVDEQSVNGLLRQLRAGSPSTVLGWHGSSWAIKVIGVSIRARSRRTRALQRRSATTFLFVAPALILAVLIGAVAIRSMSGGVQLDQRFSTYPEGNPSPKPSEEVAKASLPPGSNDQSQLGSGREPAEDIEVPIGPRKLYKSMTDEERREFIKERAGRIAIMMGKRPYAFTPDALEYIKFWLDAFAGRVGNNRTGLWRGDTRFILERGTTHAPLIIHAFKENRVPPVIRLYIPFIETEYNNIRSNNGAGAAGLFQFLGPTAEHYGVPSSERTDVARMAPAAARYFRDNIMSFGDDSMSVALAIAGYNRAPESVKRDLRNVLSAGNNEDKERNFWTLVANQGKLDHFFQNENKNYVPRFLRPRSWAKLRGFQD